MADSCRRLEMPVFPEDKFVEAIEKVVEANEAYRTTLSVLELHLYIRPYMFGSDPVIGVKPANEYQFRIFTTPVGPYFKEGAKPITIRVSDYDRAAPRGTGNIKAGSKLCNEPLPNHGSSSSEDLMRICILTQQQEQK